MLTDSATRLLAIGLLAAAALALACWAVVAYRRTQYTLVQAALYLLCHVMVRVLWRARVPPRLPIADGQGAVIVSNHRSPLDPAMVAVTTRRAVRWMVAHEYTTSPWVAWFFRVMRAIGVRRGRVDTAATRQAIRAARDGELVGIFPEGRLNQTDRPLLPGRPGAAMIALAAGVPIVPCHVRGTPRGRTMLSPILMTARARLTVGEPIDVAPYQGAADEGAAAAELTKRLLAEIARLDGIEGYEPQLAGRQWMAQ
jgi:1-acyl-sn-glycerol-3-phosphate acyltransferase